MRSNEEKSLHGIISTSEFLVYARADAEVRPRTGRVRENPEAPGRSHLQKEGLLIRGAILIEKDRVKGHNSVISLYSAYHHPRYWDEE